MSVIILHGDCREIMPTLGPVDAIVTDPPYEIGFMAHAWDRRGIASDPGTWRLALDVLKPGGHLLAFGGTRTVHRLICAIEDAGFEIRDQIAWVYGDGMPKGLNVGKEIDKATDDARRWEGWGTGLKPAMELIVVARKPLIGTVVQNVLTHGTGALNIDRCRIAASDADIEAARVPQPALNSSTGHVFNFKTGKGRNGQIFDMTKGRWPANLCHDGSEEVLALFPLSVSGELLPHHKKSGGSQIGTFKIRNRTGEPESYGGDSGSAARFFFSAKAGSEARWGSKHPTVKPVTLKKWLVTLVTPPGGTVLDPFAGSGTTGVAAMAAGRNAILIEREDEYIADIRERIAFYEGGGRHSAAAKHRKRQVDYGPLFASAEALPRPDESAE